MDADDKLRQLRKAIAEKQQTAMKRLLAAAADSEDAAVRAAWSEHKALGEVAEELKPKREDQ